MSAVRPAVLGACWRVWHSRCSRAGNGVLTNMMSNAQYRGGAKPEPVHVLEVMVDMAARQLGIDAVELRRRNTLTPDMLPFKTSMGDYFDCGDFTGNYESCLAAADYSDLAIRRASASARGKLLGFGTSNSITGVANSNFEHVEIRFDASGGVRFYRVQWIMGKDTALHLNRYCRIV